MGAGFVTEIRVPAGVSGLAPVLSSLYPMSTALARYGQPVGMYSDYTIRNEAGTVLWDGHVANPGKYFNSGGVSSKDVARYANGSPLLVQPTDPRSSGTTGGIAAGEQPRDNVFVQGVGALEPVYDSAVNGGWGAPVTTSGGGGAPSSYARRDDRWVWSDGRITDAQGTVVGRWTTNMDDAARQIAARGPTPSIIWNLEAQVVHSGNTGGGASDLPPESESGYEVRTVQTTQTPVTLDPDLEDPDFPEVMTTTAVPRTTAGGSGGTDLGMASGGSPAGAQPAAGTPGAGGLEAFLKGTTVGVPNWAWLAAAAVIYWRNR